MKKLTKRMQLIKDKVTPGKVYKLEEALELLKALKKTKFKESIDIALNLGIDPTKSDQGVRGAAVMPHGTGKTVRVAVFAQADKAEEARKAGADIVGFEDLSDKIKAGELNFDVLIATPDAMRLVGALGQILGPKNLMPNPKVGTVTKEVGTAVKNAKSGQVQYRSDKSGIIHCAVGNIEFKTSDLIENIRTLVDRINKAKPAAVKKVYLKSMVVSSTMGPGLPVAIEV